ncbi:hypothetical protein MCEGEM3_00480 [Oxalobacteraceae bacterium]
MLPKYAELYVQSRVRRVESRKNKNDFSTVNIINTDKPMLTTKTVENAA